MWPPQSRWQCQYCPSPVRTSLFWRHKTLTFLIWPCWFNQLQRSFLSVTLRTLRLPHLSRVRLLHLVFELCCTYAYVHSCTFPAFIPWLDVPPWAGTWHIPIDLLVGLGSQQTLPVLTQLCSLHSLSARLCFLGRLLPCNPIALC